MEQEIWYARVGTSDLTELRLPSALQKKKEPARIPSAAKRSARERAIADFPAPAGPKSHETWVGLRRSFAHSEKRLRSATRVPG